uniref:Uncharacterized protein n=1 Tax=Hubei sobemo-like virus 39 TaxID=1923226 RepID=A0A1L3KEF1_9VIRU|nr:hypothetical protein 1 [Hubei sobemo-like virus 39]
MKDLKEMLVLGGSVIIWLPRRIVYLAVTIGCLFLRLGQMSLSLIMRLFIIMMKLLFVKFPLPCLLIYLYALQRLVVLMIPLSESPVAIPIVVQHPGYCSQLISLVFTFIQELLRLVTLVRLIWWATILLLLCTFVVEHRVICVFLLDTFRWLLISLLQRANQKWQHMELSIQQWRQLGRRVSVMSYSCWESLRRRAQNIQQLMIGMMRTSRREQSLELVSRVVIRENTRFRLVQHIIWLMRTHYPGYVLLVQGVERACMSIVRLSLLLMIVKLSLPIVWQTMMMAMTTPPHLF